MEQKNQMLTQIEARRDDFAGHHVNFYGKLKINLRNLISHHRLSSTVSVLSFISKF